MMNMEDNSISSIVPQNSFIDVADELLLTKRKYCTTAIS